MEQSEKLNVDVRSWAGSTLKEIKNQYSGMVNGQSGNGMKSFKFSSGKSFGEINRISFGFNRYLVFVHKGAGKGKGGSKGSSWINKSGNKVTTNPGSLGKMNTGQRKSKEFLNPVLERKLPILADIVAGFKADQVVKAIQIK